jgi:hypothetical protein
MGTWGFCKASSLLRCVAGGHSPTVVLLNSNQVEVPSPRSFTHKRENHLSFTLHWRENR